MPSARRWRLRAAAQRRSVPGSLRTGSIYIMVLVVTVVMIMVNMIMRAARAIEHAGAAGEVDGIGFGM